ncbi:MAG TPA: hypothetical protein VI861_03790 [Rickettsiales bacterium]|nr:hypothetical protein [Rickettsiales bacterium]
MIRFFIFAIALFFPLNSFAVQAFDDKELDKKGDFNITSRLFIDNVVNDEYQATNRKNEYKNTYLMFDFATIVRLRQKWFGYVNYRIQENPVQASETERRAALANGGGDKTYENHAGVLRELFVGYDGDVVKVYGGKFRPDFGRSYYIGRGIWAGELTAVRYNLLEKIGVGGLLKAGDEKTIGKYEIGASFFTNDRKNIDNSQITVRDRVSKSDAKIGDTRSLQSYVVNLDIKYNFAVDEKLFYRFSYMDLSPNSDVLSTTIAGNKIANQKGYSATMSYLYPLIKNYDVDFFIEYASLKNVAGNSDISEQYLSTSLKNIFYKNWNLTLAYEESRIKHIDQNGQDNFFSEISAGYTFFGRQQFFDRLNFQVGHKHLRANNKTDVDKRNSYGLMVRYIKLW